MTAVAFGVTAVSLCTSSARSHRARPPSSIGTACEYRRPALCCPRFLPRRIHLCVPAYPARASPACKEESGVKVTSMTFNGVKAVNRAQLKSVLATGASSKLPWGEKHYFSREQFEADLKRIVAFYHDRGYPDARVTSFDVKLNDNQTSVDDHVNISEGEPILVERDRASRASSPAADQHRRRSKRGPAAEAGPAARSRAAAGEPRGGARRAQGPRLSVRDGAGSPRSPGSRDRQRVLTLTRRARPARPLRPLEIQGNSSVSDSVIRRQLTFRPRQICSARASCWRASAGSTRSSCSSSPTSSRSARKASSRPRFRRASP